MTELIKLTKKDFSSDQEVRWCPGCGDYAILSAIQRTLPKVGATVENTVFVSGIGCSSRFPYYMNTYGFHTIHGRAPAIATGLKVARPELDVWVITGDGDALSIGGNHFLHVLRRNVDMQIVLFNNRIYGLTKGQYSPTSEVGKVSPSSPFGSLDEPLSPARVALGSGAQFVARGYDISKNLPQLFERAHAFKGTGFVEVLQNCVIFNDGAFEDVSDRKTGPEHQIWLEHGKPMVSADGRRGVRLDTKSMRPEVVSLGEEYGEDDLLVHDETNRNLAWMITELEDLVALGVLFASPEHSYEDDVRKQMAAASEKKGTGELAALLRATHTWEVA